MKLSKLSDEELLKAFEQSPEEPTYEESKIASQFISSMGLKPGNKKVPFRIIWKLFKFYSNENLKKSDLGKSLRLRFKRSRNRYDVLYWINKDFKYFQG